MPKVNAPAPPAGPLPALRSRLRDVLHGLAGQETRGGDERLDDLIARSVTLLPPRDPAHGDLATNAGLVLAKHLRMAPRSLAEQLAEQLPGAAGIESAEAAGPGFVNLRVTPAVWGPALRTAAAASADYGRSSMGAGTPVNVEYVSANPTGPLHVGHGRGAVLGDAIASLLAFAGFAVTREYYINDAGGQIEQLARSIHHRYRMAAGLETEPPGNLSTRATICNRLQTTCLPPTPDNRQRPGKTPGSNGSAPPEPRPCWP